MVDSPGHLVSANIGAHDFVDVDALSTSGCRTSAICSSACQPAPLDPRHCNNASPGEHQAGYHQGPHTLMVKLEQRFRMVPAGNYIVGATLQEAWALGNLFPSKETGGAGDGPRHVAYFPVCTPPESGRVTANARTLGSRQNHACQIRTATSIKGRAAGTGGASNVARRRQPARTLPVLHSNADHNNQQSSRPWHGRVCEPHPTTPTPRLAPLSSEHEGAGSTAYCLPPCVAWSRHCKRLARSPMDAVGDGVPDARPRRNTDGGCGEQRFVWKAPAATSTIGATLE